MKFKIILLVAVSALLLNAQSQEKNEVVAKIGNKTITAKELKERFELTPRIGIKDADEAKEDLLYSIIAEKLWALEAENEKLDTTEVMQYTFPALKKMYIRDALHKKEVRDKVEIDPLDYQIGRKRSGYNVLTRFFHSNDETEIDSLYSILQSGASFDSLFYTRPQDAGNAYQVEYGKMDAFVEDSIYNTAIGNYTSPIKSPEGWYIFNVDTIMQNYFNDASAINTRDMNIRKTVENRATIEVHSKFHKSFFKNLAVNADGELFWRFSGLVIKAIHRNFEKLGEDNSKGGKIALTEKDFLDIESEIGNDTLAMPFVKFEQNAATLREFVHDFFFEGFYTFSTNPDIIRSQLNSRVRLFIEHELLAREAVREGLDKSEDVKFYNNMWRDNYLGTLFKRRLLSQIKVSDEEAFKEYNKNNSNLEFPRKVNIIEILTDSLEVVEDVLNKLDQGADIRVLAIRYSKREWARKRGGEFGLFPTTEHGEIGRIAGEMELGDIYGPLKTDEGYSIFKLIDKVEEKEELSGSFEDVKGELKKQIGLKKLKKTFNEKTAELASKYGVNIDENELKSIKVTDLSMVVYRYMGFGGRILAVPFTNTYVDWVEKWKSNQQSLP